MSGWSLCHQFRVLQKKQRAIVRKYDLSEICFLTSDYSRREEEEQKIYEASLRDFPARLKALSNVFPDD